MRKGDARWTNVSAAGGANAGTAAMGLAGSLFGKALQTAEDGLTKHQEELEKNAASEKAANTALVLKMKAEGKPVSKDFMKQLGIYDGEKINEGSMKLRAEQQNRLMNNHRMSMDNQRFAQTKIKDSAQIANWKNTAKIASGKLSYLEKKMIDARLALSKEEKYKNDGLGSYFNKSKSKFGSSNAGKFMEEVGLRPETTDSSGNTVYGSIDMDNSLIYQNAINEAIAKGRSKKEITSAMSRNTSRNNWMSNFTPQDEMDFNVNGFLKDLQL